MVFRYGHRLIRDERVTTHCCLVARALGAKGIILAGERDDALQKQLEAFVHKWGGNFKITCTEDWKKGLKELKKKGYFLVHLTMYGLPLMKEIKAIRKKRKIAFIIGSQRVPAEVYRWSDANIAVASQPHSEIAALALALHELFRGKELSASYKNAEIRISPAARGKKVTKRQASVY